MSERHGRQEITDDLIIRSLRAAGQADETPPEAEAARERFMAVLERLRTDPAERARIDRVIADSDDPRAVSEAETVLSWEKFLDYERFILSDPVLSAEFDQRLAELEDDVGPDFLQD